MDNENKNTENQLNETHDELENESGNSPLEQDNIEEITLENKTPLTKQKWFIPAVAGIVVFFILSTAVWAFFSQPDKEELNDENNEELAETTPTPTPTKSLSRPAVTETTPTPTATPSVSPTATEQISLAGPQIKENSNDTVYTYTLNLNGAAASKYSNGINYTINASNCNNKDMFKTDTDFSETLNNLKSGNNTLAISIYEAYLISKTNLKDSTFTLKDSKGNTVKTGTIKAPECKVANEKNENGEFEIEEPEIDDDLLEDKYHFTWNFIFDQDARKILEKGFTSKMKLECDKWVDEKYRNYIEYKWNAGKLGRPEYDEHVGIALNIGEDGVDLDNPTETSTYEIFDKDGDLIFSGFYQAPNCK